MLKLTNCCSSATQTVGCYFVTTHCTENKYICNSKPGVEYKTLILVSLSFSRSLSLSLAVPTSLLLNLTFLTGALLT